ncbi:hypothetical protein Holit_00839 [Hollandina sp. SP2]
MRFAALRAARAPKNRSRPTAFVRFFSATFGAGVNATHCPITRPKRRKQPERYVQLRLKFFIK